MKYESIYTRREMMAVALARQVKDGMICIAGTGLPLIGATLAKLTTAPNSVIISETGIIDGHLEELPGGVSDTRFAYHASVWWPRYRYCGFLLKYKDKIDFGFLGGAQIDPYGNLNSTCIGGYHCPITRLTGSGGANGIASCLNTVIVMRHEKRRFIEKVDYVTSPGWIDGPGGRKKAGLPEDKGPSAVVTTLGIMRFHGQSKLMYLSEFYPGVSLAEITEQTGFPVDVSGAVEAEPPSADVLDLLRKKIDPDHLYI
ncbi:MAG: glutaconate CoA-transferase [Peptococcaceae bacterium BRH_c8a]|nr:MAG: glutaconate CoA-transferase [Peptococcaceae bacterium BRH_c8a]KJS13598.1 MAG: glutaconate CoA-transferase [Peptococcaceae bacterium BRH_c8a]